MSTFSSSTVRTHRILCYGDSLTAGTSDGFFVEYPYAPHLQAGLQHQFGEHSVVVRHRGLPGWTAANMVEDLDGPATGLRAAIQGIQDPALSLVVILAGTNDLGYGVGEEEIFDSIATLHQVAWDNGVPRTIAIGIPSSGYQESNTDAKALATRVNEKLQQYCADRPKQATFVSFPFGYERDGENWARDTLHFSQRGYQVLGESLVPVVAMVLEDLDQQ